MHLCQSLGFSHFVCVQHTGRPSTPPEFFDHKLNLTILEVPQVKNIGDYTFDRLGKNLGLEPQHSGGRLLFTLKRGDDRSGKLLILHGRLEDHQESEEPLLSCDHL